MVLAAKTRHTTSVIILGRGGLPYEKDGGTSRTFLGLKRVFFFKIFDEHPFLIMCVCLSQSQQICLLLSVQRAVCPGCRN